MRERDPFVACFSNLQKLKTARACTPPPNPNPMSTENGYFWDNRPRKVRSGRVTNFDRSDTRLGRLSLPCCYQDEPVSVAPPSPLARQPRWEGSAGSPARRSRHRVNLPPTDLRCLTRDGDAPSTQGPSSPTRRGRHHHQTNLGLDASSSLGALSTRAGSPGAARPARVIVPPSYPPGGATAVTRTTPTPTALRDARSRWPSIARDSSEPSNERRSRRRRRLHTQKI